MAHFWVLIPQETENVNPLIVGDILDYRGNDLTEV